MNTPIRFNGSIPQHYEDYLTSFLFDGFAEDIVGRIKKIQSGNVLELASGTGSLTQLLHKRLPYTVQLTASDLENGMLEIAKKKLDNSNINWATVDMTDIPYEDNSFDTIVCQFGLMLVPEKLKALQEMHRVLKPGGQLLLNVWGDIHANQIWNIGGTIIESFLGINPILQDPGPFALTESNTLPLLQKATFTKFTSSVIDQTGSIETAAMAAKGFVEGLPVVLAIVKKDPLLLPQIQQALELELINQLGSRPLQSRLQALVFEAFK